MPSLKNPFILLLFGFFLLNLNYSYAQGIEKESNQERLLTDSEDYSKWISAAHINDLLSLFGITDRYYSFGLKMDYMKRIKAPIIRHKPSQYYYSIGLNFDGYTPDHKLDNPDSTTTRPFAAWSYISLSFKKMNPTNYFHFNLEIGIVGPKVGAEKFQNWVHKNISNDPQVIGWEDQIEKQMGINLLFDYKRTVSQHKKHQVFVGSEQKIGNIFTYVWPRIQYQFNANEGIGFLPIKYARSSNSALIFETSVGFKYEFYNLTIEGEPANNSMNTLDEAVINRALFTAGFGVRYHYKKFGVYLLNQFNTYRIKDNQNHVFGTLGFAYSWD